jgi:glucokinase
MVALAPRTLLAVDIGGTKTLMALIRAALPDPSLAGQAADGPRVLKRTLGPTDISSERRCLDELLRRLAEIIAGEAVDGIGIGTPSMVDFAHGIVVASVNVPLTDVPLRDLVGERLGLPVAVDNDATAAALGEHTFGAGAGTTDMVMLTLGTGVGGGVIAGGRILRGFTGAGGELGHLVVDENGPPCPGASCPNHGCLEAYVSGTAMGLAALAEARAKPRSALGRALAAGETVDGTLLGRLAIEGDPDARAVMARVGEYLGVGITTLVNIFNPQLVVVGGAAAGSGELLLGPARHVVARRALYPQSEQARIVSARFGEESGIMGAAALALAELF